jgi:hypothetical protein
MDSHWLWKVRFVTFSESHASRSFSTNPHFSVIRTSEDDRQLEQTFPRVALSVSLDARSVLMTSARCFHKPLDDLSANCFPIAEDEHEGGADIPENVPE